MVLSKRCEYALLSALYLSAPERGAYTAVREVSEALGLPQPFLAKIVQALAQAGVVRTLRGKKGGIALARPPADVTLREIVVAVDGPGLFRACVLRLPGCDDARPCPLHAQWTGLRAAVERMFAEATLAAVAADTRQRGLRLSALVPALPLAAPAPGDG